MIPPTTDDIVIAYVRIPNEKHPHVLFTIAIYDPELKMWLDILQEEPNTAPIDVIHWEPIPPPPHYAKMAVSPKSRRYNAIYKNLISRTT